MILEVVVQPGAERNLAKTSSKHHRKPVFITQFVAVSGKGHDIWCFLAI
jgi:hypothetical protein